jgi:arylsulfatase A-like enzyme
MKLSCAKISLMILCGVTLAGITTCRQPSTQATRPNVLFIICDDLNDYPGAFGGHPQAITPNMDRLAVSGIRFTNAQSNCPVCSPSRNSLFTGVYPFESGDFGWTKNFEQPVLKHNLTLMELFMENGYRVMGSGKLLHVNRKEYWTEWGIEINNYGPFAYNGHETVGHPSVPEPFRSIGPVDGSYAPLSDVPVFHDSISGGNQTGWLYTPGRDEFLEYTDENNRGLMPDEMHARWAAERIREMDAEGGDQPFFMGIGFVRPHTPLIAPDRFFDMYPLDELVLSEILENDAEDTHYKDLYPAERKGLRYYRTLKESYGGDAEEGLKHFLQAYLACVTFVDEQIGTVLDALDQSRFKDNTIVFLVTDHGWQMGEKDYVFKNSPWEESTRIPYVIRSPGHKTGDEVDHPVSLIDVFPTLVDLCGLSGDPSRNEGAGSIGGFSLRPFLENPKTRKWEGPEGALTMLGVGPNKEDPDRQTYSYRTKDWRYIRYYDGSEELYHNRVDPYEWENLADDDDFTSVKEELRAEMRKIMDR